MPKLRGLEERVLIRRLIATEYAINRRHRARMYRASLFIQPFDMRDEAKRDLARSNKILGKLLYKAREDLCRADRNHLEEGA